MNRQWLGLGLLLLTAASHAATPAASTALWLGEFRIGGESTAIVLHAPAGAAAGASIDLPALGARGVAVEHFVLTPQRVGFEVRGGPQALRLDGSLRDGRLHGRAVRGAAIGDFVLEPAQPVDPVHLRRLAGSYEVAPGHVIDIGPMDEIGGMLVFLDHATLRQGPLYSISDTRFVSGPTIGIPYPFQIVAEFVVAEDGGVTGMQWRDGTAQRDATRIAPHRSEDVSVANGDVVLKGSLLLPAGPGPHPAIVLAHGSGDATRNVGVWNQFFVRRGFAVLSLDKRGSGESSGDWRASGMEDIAADWLAGVEMLRQRSDIDAARIGVHGSSQGGWTAPLMAVRSDHIAFVIVRAGSAVGVAETMAWEVGWSVREAGFSDAQAKAAEAASLRSFELADAPFAQFEAFAAPLKSEPWAQSAWPLHLSDGGWGRPWSVRNAGYDPAATLARLRQPVLWFLADLDHNVPVAASEQALIAARRASGNDKLTIVRLPGSGHSFTQSTTGNNASFVRDRLMVAGYWDHMAAWLDERRKE